MDVTIHSSMLPHEDPEASRSLLLDALGFEVRNDVEYRGMHWITGGPQGMTSPVAYCHVPDIQAKLAEVAAAGATIVEPARDVGGGRLVATVTDPDGNVLGLIQDR